MRAAFGLIGLLVCVGVIVLIIHKTGYLDTVTSTPVKNAQQQSKQVSGIGFRESVVLEPESKGGKLSAIDVTKIVPGGPAETYFGLKENDTIVGYTLNGAQMAVKDQNDEELVKAQIMEAYQKSGTLTVIRDDQRITLPQG